MRDKIFKEKYFLFKAKNKDPEAFAKVYDFYAERIYRFIYFKVSNKEDAQDLTSEVFLKTWQYIIDGGKEIKNLNALFYKVARNLVVDYYRKGSSQKEVLLEDEMLERQAKITEGLEKIEAKLQVEKIEAKLKELKDEYREVIILRHVDGLSIADIAEIFGRKKGAVRVLLYRALNTLKELMEEKK